jgi:hypothetical protein
MMIHVATLSKQVKYDRWVRQKFLQAEIEQRRKEMLIGINK